MKLVTRLWNTIGAIATLVTLLLSWPGIQIARADEHVSKAPDSHVEAPSGVLSAVGPLSCQGVVTAGDPIAELREKIALAEARAKTTAPAPGTTSREAFVLNNGGYNYGATPTRMPSPAQAAPPAAKP